MSVAMRVRARVTAAVLLASGAALAQDAAPSVLVFVAAPPEESARLEGAVGAAARPLRWVRTAQIDPEEVLQRPSGQGLPATARVWIDGARADRLRLYFVNWATERFLVRDVPLHDGLNEVALETVAQLIESAISALLSNAPIGLTRAEMVTALHPTLEAPPPPAVAATARWQPIVAAFYALQASGPDLPVEQGPGVLARLERRDARWTEGAWLSTQYQLPERIASELAGVRLDTAAFRAGAAVGRAIGARTALDVQLGAGVDLTRLAPRAGSEGTATALTADRFGWSYAAQAGIDLTVQLAPHVVVSTTLFADVDLAARRYGVVVDGNLVLVATPWRARPGIRLEVGWR
jgi:hypothetical protein